MKKLYSKERYRENVRRRQEYEARAKRGRGKGKPQTRGPHVVTIPITAPRTFSFVNNPDEMSALLRAMRGHARAGRKIKMDMRNVGEMTSDGIAVFTAQIARQRAMDIRGNEPRIRRCPRCSGALVFTGMSEEEG